MKRVTGIGGIFLQAQDPDELREWYSRHLGIQLQDWGGAVFQWADDPHAPNGSTTWSVSKAPAEYFAPGTASFMVNYRVSDLMALLALLREEGCDVVEATEESEFGKFGWVIDPEGNKIELWEPPAGQ
jgi:predicted enzyme related to lactoylglutathione lyase